MPVDKPFRSKKSTSATAIPGPHTHPESDVTSLIADLATKVPTTRLVNGHALSADVTVTADDVLPTQASNSGKFLTTNGTTSSWATPTGGGSGDVVGPASAVSGNLPSFSGTTGKLIADSGLAAAAVATLTGSQTLTNKTFTAPILGTPASGTLTNCTGLPESGVTNLVTDLAAKQPLDADLTTIAGLTATTDNFMVAAASAWASRTPAQAKTSLALVKADVGLGSVDNTADAAKAVLSATKWATGRTVSITGDLAYTSPTLDGTGNVTAAGTLATVNSNTGVRGTAAIVPVFTVNGKGIITAVIDTPIAIAGSQVTSGQVPVAQLATGTPAAGKYLDGSGAWTTLPRPTGWKFNLLATSAVTTNPGSGNVRFFTGGVALFVNYTDSDAKSRSAYLLDLFNLVTLSASVTNGTTATELGTCTSFADFGTHAELDFTVAMDPSVFTASQPIYLVVTGA